MRTGVLLLLAVLPGFLAAQPAATPVCDSAQVRVVTPSLFYVHCDQPISAFDGTGTLAIGLEVRKTDPVAPPAQVITDIHVTGSSFSSWLEVRLATPLVHNRQYALVVQNIRSASTSVALNPPFRSFSVAFSTEAKAQFASAFARRRVGSNFTLLSTVALRPPNCVTAPDRSCHTSAAPSSQGGGTAPLVQFYEVLHKAYYDPNNPTKVVTPEKDKYYDAKVQIPAALDLGCPPSAAPGRIPDPADVGGAQFFLTNDRLTTESAILGVRGLKNIFCDDVVVDADQAVALAKVPKGKDDATEYFKLSHSAGPNSKPTWQADTKWQPLLGYGGGLYHHLNFTTDIGGGQGVNVSDLVHIGYFAEHTLAKPDWRGFIRIAPGATYETNRTFTQQNGLFDGEAEFRLDGLYQPLKERSRRLYTTAALAAGLKPEQIAPAPFGAGVQFFLGIEAGRSFVDVTTSNKSKTAAVSTTPYNIVRPRPRIRAFLEFKWVSFEFNAALRYLALEEQAGRVVSPDDSKSPVILRRIHGFRPYGDASINIPLDRGKHLNLNTKYKLGSLPPLFNKVNTVQSGLLIAF